MAENNLDGIGIEEPSGTPAGFGEETLEEPTGQDEESKEEEIPEDVEELKRGYMRQADYTRKTTELAMQRGRLESLEQDSRAFYALMEDPEIREKAVRLSRGEEKVEEVQLPNPQENPMGYLEGLIENKLNAAVNRLRSDIKPMLVSTKEQAVNADFNALSTKYPAALSIGKEAITRVMDKYSGMTMEEAFRLVAPPTAFIPKTQKTQSKPSPRVEKPNQAGGRSGMMDSTKSRTQNLREQALQYRKDGVTVDSIVKKVADTLGFKGR